MDALTSSLAPTFAEAPTFVEAVPVAPPRPRALSAERIAALAIVMVAVLTRLPAFGDPLVHLDEEFYLLVGQRMLDGAWPYIDIYDRKPFLLFALNAAFAATGFAAVYVSQLAALACACMTGWLLRRLALEIAPPLAATLAGVAYVGLLPAFHGIGAQAPLFYNLAMVLAALAMLRALRSVAPAAVLRWGMAAMLLVGIALQVKYSVVFEGIAFGTALAWRYHRQGGTYVETLGAAALLALGALVPTLAVFAGFAIAGHAGAWWDANIIANMSTPRPLGEALPRLGANIALLLGLLVPAVIGALHLRGEREAAPVLALLWAGSAAAGYLVYGTWYDHYTLALLAPLAVLAAPALARPGLAGRVALPALLFLSIAAGEIRAISQLNKAGTAAEADAVTASIADRLDGGCLFVFSGDPAYYRTSRACTVSRYLFPDHLSRVTATDRMTSNPHDELAQIFARRPQVVVRSDRRHPDSDPVAAAIAERALLRDYELAARLPNGSATIHVYAARQPAPAARFAQDRRRSPRS